MPRSRDVRGTTLLLLLGALTSGPAQPALGRTALPPCAPGRFLLDPAAGPLVPGGPGPGDAIVVGDAQVTLESCGPPDRTRVHVRRRATVVRARWDACGDARRVRLHAKIRHADCAVMRGVIRGRRLGRRRFSATRSTCGDGRLDPARGEQCDPSAPGGDGPCPGACDGAVPCRCPIDGVPGVGGHVSVALPGRLLPLYGATVSLRGPDPVPPDALTDPTGRFRFLLADALVPADVTVCAGAPGFEERCEPVTIERSDWGSVELVLESAGALVGTVRSAAGVPCLHRSPTFGTSAQAEVAIEGSSSTVLANDRGEWALPGVTPGRVTVEARCGSDVVREAVDVAPEDLDGVRTIDLVLPNHPPHIRALVARDAGGAPVRRARPGSALVVTMEATDEDGDPLDVRWLDGAVGLLDEHGPEIAWTLPEEPARNLLWVEVTDGRGGFATEQLDVATGMTDPRLAGRVVDGDDRPLAGVRVTVNGLPVVTGADGDFRAVVPPAPRYAVAVAEPGLAPTLRVFEDEAHGIVLRTTAARAHPIDDAGLGVVIQDPDAGLAIEIPPRGLVDAAGDPAAAADGPYVVDVHLFGMTDADPPPGDARGADDGFSVRGAIAIDVVGRSGAHYRLADATTARVTIPILPAPDPCGASVSEPIQAVHWDDQTLGWQTMPAGVLPDPDGASWTFDATDLGILAVAVPTTTTCLRLRADRGTIVVPLRVTVRRFTGCFAGGDTPLYAAEQEVIFPDYDWHTLTLAADAYYELVVQAEGLTGAVHPGNTLLHRIHTGPATPLVAYPFLGCEERTDLLNRRDPGQSDAWYDGFFTGWYNEGSAAGAADYYAAIGAVPAKDTYGKWTAANAFGTTPSARAIFYNAAELGVGRDVVCHQGTGLACVITKYGAPGGPVAQTIDDLEHGVNPGDRVAIDWEPGLEQARFYVFGPDGALKPYTHFTPGGPLYMPDACSWCHTFKRFVPLDPNTHLYGPLHPRTSEEESLRRINAMVASVPATSDRSKALVAHLYPQGVNTPGAVAVDAAPQSYQDAGTGAVFVYRQVVRSHCQLCHLNTGPNWTSYADLTDPTNAYAAMSRVCETTMPAMFVPNRNFRQGNFLLATLRGHLVGALPPYDFPWDDHPVKTGTLTPQEYLKFCLFDTVDVREEPSPP